MGENLKCKFFLKLEKLSEIETLIWFNRNKIENCYYVNFWATMYFQIDKAITVNKMPDIEPDQNS